MKRYFCFGAQKIKQNNTVFLNLNTSLWIFCCILGPFKSPYPKKWGFLWRSRAQWKNIPFYLGEAKVYSGYLYCKSDSTPFVIMCVCVCERGFSFRKKKTKLMIMKRTHERIGGVRGTESRELLCLFFCSRTFTRLNQQS